MTTEEDTMKLVGTGVGLSVLGLGAGILLKNISSVTSQKKRKKTTKRRK